MDTEAFLRELKLPANADLDVVERTFGEFIRERLRYVAESYTETELKEEDMVLRGSMDCFFAYVAEWVNKEGAKYKNVREFETAPKVRVEAKAVVSDLQAYMKEFISCYMHLGRFMTLLRDEIKTEEIRVGALPHNKIRWTADSGIVIARYRKEKKIMVDRMDRLVKARAVLETIDAEFDNFKSSAVTVLGKEKAELLNRRFIAALRIMDFRKAKKALEEITDGKKKFGFDQKTAKQAQDSLMQSAAKILAVVEETQKILVSEENRLFLRPVEADLAYNSDVRELQKIKAFLGKYHLPYMQYKLDTLGHLKDKLMIINSLDSLMGTYKRLIMGIALPMTDLKTVRLYEGEIINHVKYLLTGHFTELPKIMQRAEETVAEFRQSRMELEEFEQMNLQEIQITDAQAAQA